MSHRINRLEPEFVEEIPQVLEPGRLYISIAYATAQHLCCCGCDSEVVTPLHPARWSLIYDGETVSLSPSVGSWNLPCGSHYIISKSKVRWAEKWSARRIEAGQERDREVVQAYFEVDDEPDRNAASAGIRRLLHRISGRSHA